jgi:hypothetical protein
MAYAGIENALIGAAEETLWDELKKVLTWPVNAIKTQQYFSGGLALGVMWYASGGFPGQGLPCETVLKGYLLGGLAYYGSIAIAAAPPK